MLKAIYAIVVGLVGAGVVHILIVLSVPSFADQDAWTRLSDVAETFRMVRLDSKAPAVLHAPDPAFADVACRFDLSEGPLHLQADGSVPFWSASIYDRGGSNIYSFNDRTAIAGALDIIVSTPSQMVELRKEMPAELEHAVFIELDIDSGIAVVRALQPDATWKPTVDDYLSSLVCEAL